MSGESHVEDCPRCGTTLSMECYSDWKPHSMVGGVCHQCGYAYTTRLFIIGKQDLQEERENINYTPIETTEEMKRRMEKYDKDMGVEQ